MLTVTEGKKYNIREVSQWGIVVDNNDPLKLQRVKVRLDAYPKNMTVEQIPWATPFRKTFQGSGVDSFGTISVPEINSVVRVIHMYDQYSPCYVDEIQSTIVDNLVNNELIDYPRVYGAKDSNKNYYRMELVKKLLKVLMEAEIQVNQTGDVRINLDGDIHLKCNNLLLESSGGIQVTAGQFNTNSNFTAGTIETSNLKTQQLSAEKANVIGTFQGTLEGTSFYATYSGIQPSPQPIPEVSPIEMPEPIKPKLDFDTK